MSLVASLGLTLYNLTAWQAGAQVVGPRPSRPAAQMVWLHLSQSAQWEAALLLARQLVGAHGFGVLITGMAQAGTDGAGFPETAIPKMAIAEPGIVLDTAPPDHPAQVQAFLAHWQVEVIVMIGAVLRPALIAAAKAKSTPLLLVEAEAPQLLRGTDRLFFGLTRGAVAAFHAIMAVNETSARAYRKLGAAHVMRLGRMEEGHPALPHNEPERAALAALFQTRPVWLAVDVPPEEEAAVISAHRAALRLAHRLLLILVPQDPSRAAELASTLEAGEGWIVARRDLDQEPDAETAVYIADAGQEYGLWYRLAPVTFLGGSLYGAGCARAPFEAAALGSAIIHGRKAGAYGKAFGLLGAALGAAPVSTADELAEFLTELLSPDRVARMAHAAWAVVSEGAEVTDRILAATVQLAEGGANART